MRPAIVILGQGSLATARKLQRVYPGALIHGLAGRVEGADHTYSEFGATLRQLYQQGTPLIALCAAGIIIRTLAPLLLEKGEEPAVLAVAEDGSAVVPLLGGLGGVNVMARDIAAALGVAAAITTSGELRFGTCLLNPPAGYQLADLELGKRFVSDLLAGRRGAVAGSGQSAAGSARTLGDSREQRPACAGGPRITDLSEDGVCHLQTGGAIGRACAGGLARCGHCCAIPGLPVGQCYADG